MTQSPDQLDLSILSCLLENAEQSFAEIAQRTGAATATVHGRIKKMEQSGIILGKRLQVDPARLGLDLCAFIGVYLEKGSVYRQVLSAMEGIPEIVEAHYTTGGYGVFIKIRCRNTDHLRQILNDNIQSIEGIQRTETFISLEEPIQRNIKLSVDI